MKAKSLTEELLLSLRNNTERPARKSGLLLQGVLARVERAGARDINHPLCGCATIVILKNHLSVIMKVFKPHYNERRDDFWQIKLIVLHTQNGCVSIILYSPQSIDEKSYTINIGKVSLR